MTEFAFPEVQRNLKDFQRATVDHVFEQLYGAGGARRFLVADEVGLGKTLVARGVIARAIEKLQHEVERIDIVYVCSNAEIARQNLQKLNVTDEVDFALAERITLLPLQLRSLTGTTDARRRLNFVSFTPGTSLDLKNRMGTAKERALIDRLLGMAWGRSTMRSKGAINLMRATSQVSGYKAWTEYVAAQPLDATMAQRFADTVAQHPDLRARFEQLKLQFSRDRPSQEARSQRAAWIGELRRLLAKSCVDELEPDLIILDEFQRFKRLLEGDDDAAELAQQLFEYRDARVLLLSATPYKMYTLSEDPEDDHYGDFLATIRFLVQDDHQAMHAFERELSEYRRAVLRLADDGEAPVIAARNALQNRLQRVMVRTERLALTEDRMGMLTHRDCPGDALTSGDLRSFVEADALSKALGTGDVLEYWKSIPYPVNFLDDYKLGKALEAAEIARRVPSLPIEGALPWEQIAKYRKIDPKNPRLRSLISQTVGRGMWRLLWLPASLPYYKPGAPFDADDAHQLTKRLVFSSWTAVPRSVATLTSYAAEREMVHSNGRHLRNTSEARKRFRSLLAVSLAEGRPAGMPVFALLYPGVGLAELTDPLEIGRELGAGEDPPSLTAVRREAERRVAMKLAPWLEADAEGPVDERWYWAAALLIDGEERSRWLGEPGAASRWTSGPEEERVSDEGGWSAHIAAAAAVFDTPLGRPPDDLVAVVADIGIAAPGVTALRALRRVADPERSTESLRGPAASVAWAFRSLFGTSEATEMIRGLGSRSDTSPYWRQVLRYCVNGGLQAVLDEYAYVLVEALGLLDRTRPGFATAIAAEMRNAVSIRTPVYSIKDLRRDGSGARRESQTMRTHFAVRFGDEKQEDGHNQRLGAVRRAFNSPFWPFVLASTSVGQEGLDFHLYCHAVMHWNLPANPVDLEQREGRVHRYKNHAVRKNVAVTYRSAAFAGHRDPWQAMFDAGDAARTDGQNQLVPSWIFAIPGGAQIERYVPTLPYSRDAARLVDLSRSLAAYRLAFGQPRQEDLVAYLRDRIAPSELTEMVAKLGIDLSPPVTR